MKESLKMKKLGFTLAEVLITLTIIGVIAALVLPTFTAGIQKRKIGPKLAKAVSVFEQATQAVLDDAQSDSISGAMVKCSDDATALAPLTSDGCFTYHLGHHMKGSGNGWEFESADGVLYSLGGFSAPTLFPSGGTATIYPHENKINEMKLNLKPNGRGMEGYEVFVFNIMDDGTLIPFGSSRGPDDQIWSQDGNCPRDPENRPGKPELCAGHVLENNLRVDYK
jgi:prepilin-type N-terminal cleavage/methylation domain-containing protein